MKKRGPFGEERRKRRMKRLAFAARERIYLHSRKVKESLDKLFGKTPTVKLTW